MAEGDSAELFDPRQVQKTAAIKLYDPQDVDAEAILGVLGFFRADTVGKALQKSGWTVDEEIRRLRELANCDKPKIALAAMELLRRHAREAAEMSGHFETLHGRSTITTNEGHLLEVEKTQRQLVSASGPRASRMLEAGLAGIIEPPEGGGEEANVTGEHSDRDVGGEVRPEAGIPAGVGWGAGDDPADEDGAAESAGGAADDREGVPPADETDAGPVVRRDSSSFPGLPPTAPAGTPNVKLPTRFLIGGGLTGELARRRSRGRKQVPPSNSEGTE